MSRCRKIGEELSSSVEICRKPFLQGMSDSQLSRVFGENVGANEYLSCGFLSIFLEYTHTHMSHTDGTLASAEATLRALSKSQSSASQVAQTFVTTKCQQEERSQKLRHELEDAGLTRLVRRNAIQQFQKDPATAQNQAKTETSSTERQCWTGCAGRQRKSL